MIYRASGFGFLPKQLFTAAFIKTPFSLSPCYASCYLGVPPGTGFPGDWGAVLGLLPLAFPLVGGSGQSTEVGYYCHSRVRVYCPAQLGAWVLDLLYVYSTVYGYPRTNGRGQVSPVPVLVSPVGGPHSLRGVVGAAVVRNYRKTGVHAPKHLRRTPPLFLAARPFGNRHSKALVNCEIGIQKPWSTARHWPFNIAP